MFFLISLAVNTYATETARIIQQENGKDIVASFIDENCLEYKNIINPKNGERVDGYIFKDNTICKLAIANLNAVAKPFSIVNYYYDSIENNPIRILNMESMLFSGDNYQVIPEHTYVQLKNLNKVKDRLFVLECEYEVKNNDLAMYFHNFASLSDADKLLLNAINFYIDDDGNCIEKKKTEIFFQLVDDEFFDEYAAKSTNKLINTVNN